MAGASKPTTADIDAMKNALQTLKGLQAQLGNGTGGAYAKLQGAQDISADLGPLLNGTGPQIAAYYQQHAMKISSALQLCGTGVGAAIAMLQASISRYETHENNTSGAANATGTGGASSGGTGVTASRGVL